MSDRKDRIIKMHNDIHMLKQMRKALNDIQESFTADKPHKAEYQLYVLRMMIDEQPSRRKPWFWYRGWIAEEFDE